MLDRYWFGDANRLSPEAPVPVVLITRTEQRLGGAANVARNIASLGARSCMLGVMGNDEPGRHMRKLLADDGIEDLLHAEDDVATIVKLRVIGRQQQMLRVDFEQSPSKEVLLDALEDFERVLPSCDVVALSDYGKGGLKHIRDMIGMARAAGRPIIVDPKGSDYDRYAGANIIAPNRAELAQAVGEWRTEGELRSKAHQLRRKLGLDALLLTKSEEGMSLFHDGEDNHFPAEARDVYDVSGAGDTVVATLAVMLGTGHPLSQAVPIANRAGGIVVGKFGTATITNQDLFKH
jgi:rfaE bifunctional protein kinase chain/domain